MAPGVLSTPDQEAADGLRALCIGPDTARPTWAAKEQREFWLPIQKELWREAKREGVADSANLFLLKNEIRRLRRELASEALAPTRSRRCT